MLSRSHSQVSMSAEVCPVTVMETKFENGRGKDIRSDINEDVSDRLSNRDDHYNSVTSLASIGSVIINYSSHHPDSKPKTRVLPNGGRLVATLYAIIIVLLSAAFTVKEALQKSWLTDYVIAVFLAYLYGISTIFIIFLEVYLVREARRHALIPRENKPKASIIVKNATVESDNEVSSTGIVNRGFTASTDDGDNHPSSDDITSRSRADTQHVTDNIELYIIGDTHMHAQLPHQTSFYLRIGAIIFGLGCMVYDGLLLKQLQENHSPSSCGEHHLVWPHYIHLIFLLVQTYFIFKHPQVHLTKLKPLARLGFMHLLSTNWSIWIRTLVRETLDSYLRHENPVQNNYTQTIYNTEKTATDMGCNTDSDILQQAAPYLFPCVLEYSLLAMATMYSMYADVGFLYKKEKDDSPDPVESGNGHPDHVHLTEVNFHKTHRGLFIGIIVLAATCVSIILFFSYMNNDSDSHKPVLIYYVSSLALTVMCIAITAIAWFQIRKLTSMRIGRTTVDDVMLMVAMSGLLLFNMFKIMPVIQSLWTGSASDLLYLQLCDCLLIMVMGVFQTCFLLDGLCRVTTSKDILKNKPGRGSVTFLLLANIALWLLKTFQIKEVELDDELQDDAYSYLAWQLIIHACIPLLIFYHYHSSACLAQIWSSSYKAVSEEESPKSNEVRNTNNATQISNIQTSNETPRSMVLKRRIPNSNLVDNGRVVSPISNV